MHLSLLYLQPWRPTFCLMSRREAEDDDGDSVPLALVHSSIMEARLSGPVCFTVWEVIEQLNLGQTITLSCFRFVASPRLGGPQLQLFKQRVQPFGCEPITVWGGKEVGAAKRSALVARARAARGRGRGGRGRGRRPRAGRGAAVDDAGDGAAPDGEADMEADPELLALEDELMADVEDGEDDFEDDIAAGFFDIPRGIGGEDMGEAVADGASDAEHAMAVAMGISSESAAEGEFSGSSVGEKSDESVGDAVVRLKIPVEGTVKCGRIHMTHIGERKEMYAQCPFTDTHGWECRRTRTCRPGARAATGRPLGGLAAWLKCGKDCASKEEHMKVVPNRASRIAGRASIMDMVHGAAFAAFERDRIEGEASEPEMCP